MLTMSDVPALMIVTSVDLRGRTCEGSYLVFSFLRPFEVCGGRGCLLRLVPAARTSSSSCDSALILFWEPTSPCSPTLWF